MSNKKKVIVTIDWFDPAYKAGGPVISLIKLIENLHDVYDFFIITGSNDYGDINPLDVVNNQWVNWRGMAQVYYLSADKKKRRFIFDLLDSQKADIYYVQGIFSWAFSILPLIWWHQAKEDKLILAPRGMLHSSALSVKKYKKKIYLLFSKIMGLFNHVYYHSTNALETSEIRKTMGQKVNIQEASNFPHILPFAKENTKRNPQCANFICVARISPEKNTRFLLDSFALVKSNVKLSLVGNYLDESYFRSILKRIEKLPANVKVEYIGHKKLVELEEVYRANDFFILPTMGENFGHAIAEALYSGLPCLISENTPWRGLAEAVGGFDIPLDENLFAEKIDVLSNLNDAAYNAMCQAAREFIDNRVSVAAIRKKYLEMLS